jgi:hypothetical protein
MYVMEKQATPIGRVLAIAMVCTNQEYITNRGGDEKTLCRFA